MKRIFVLFLALALLLTACAAPTPGVTTETATATDEPGLPYMTETPAPTAVAPPEVTATSTKASGTGGGTMFTDLIRSSDSFSLKCSPSEIIFSVKSLNDAITKVMFYYRVIDKDSTMPAGAMVNSGTMIGGSNGNFTLELSALDLNENLRYPNAWFEYQFVGLNKAGAVIGRSDKIVKQVTFTVACP